jgi:two-component system cell cycle sensor histidine kinase/response regulator CckA
VETDARVAILCVDGDPHLLEGLSRTLRKDFVVTTALSRVAGLEALRSTGPFAVVVADTRMPGEDGGSFLSLVRQTAPDTTRVLLTGQTDLNAAIAAVNQGNIFQFLSKPCPTDTLLNAIEAAAEQYRLVTAERVALENTRHREQALEVQRTRLEDQLRHSQRMEAIGQLAGGIAHDFNNLLSVIIGFGDLLLDEVGPDSRQCEQMEMVVAAGRSAATLTRQLLDFNRRQLGTPQDLELDTVIEATSRLLRRLIGEDITLITTYATDLRLVRADPGQIEQVLVNIAVNARDAMASGGTLRMSTRELTLTGADRPPHPAAHAGSYAVLTIQDNGIGMDAATQARIFEPFFTTKEAGKGTGLGLAAVYGIVTQQGGFINVDSAPGAGTTFEIYLPQIERSTDPVLAPAARPIRPHGNETILLVDDESMLRRIACLVLRGSGYTVLEAERGDQALTVVEKYVGRIDLVLTDVVMPGMNGRVLIERLAPQLPHVKVLYMSGYTNDVVLRNGVNDTAVGLLQKPFTPLTLCQTVRQVLDAVEYPLSS